VPRWSAAARDGDLPVRNRTDTISTQSQKKAYVSNHTDVVHTALAAIKPREAAE
jgi:hypothetical protein